MYLQCNYKGGWKEWKNSLPLDELFNLEEELFFDPYTSFQKKTVLVQEEINSLLSKNEHFKNKHWCKYCSKEFKKVGKSLLNHQAICLFNLNPAIAKYLNFSAFKDKVFKAKGTCPKCYMFFPSKLRQHARVCFLGVTGFS